MSWLLAWLALAGVLAAGPGRCAEPPEETTQVAGTVPDLVGRWLFVTRVEIAPGSDLGTTTTSMWTVTGSGAKPEVTLREVDLPPALQASVERANAARTRWEPSVAELLALRDGWDGLPASNRGFGHVDTKLTGSDAFDTVMQNEERMRGARFIVQQVVDYRPGEGRPIKDVFIYGALEQTPDGWAGNYMSASVAPTPVPIPITLNGTFRAYRLEAVAGQGLLARLLDMFSGCGRR